MLPMGFNLRGIGAGKEADVKTVFMPSPTRITRFEPKRLVVPHRHAGDFVVIAAEGAGKPIAIGPRDRQEAADVFELAPVGAIIPGQAITLRVKNTSGRAADFLAAILGEGT